MDGALHTAADTPRAAADRAIARSADRARRAELREGLYQPCTWLVFQTLGPAGQAGVLQALQFCQGAEEVEDAVQAAALLSIDPRRQAAAARRARGAGLTFSVSDASALARNGCSRARREHQARARSAEVRSECSELPDGDGAGDPRRRRHEPPGLDELIGAPLRLLLRAEAEADAEDEAGVAVHAAAALLTPRPRGRPTRAETLEANGQQQLPGLPPGGSTTRAAGPLQAPPPARGLGPPPEQPALF